MPEPTPFDSKQRVMRRVPGLQNHATNQSHALGNVDGYGLNGFASNEHLCGILGLLSTSQHNVMVQTPQRKSFHLWLVRFPCEGNRQLHNLSSLWSLRMPRPVRLFSSNAIKCLAAFVVKCTVEDNEETREKKPRRSPSPCAPQTPCDLPNKWTIMTGPLLLD